MRSGSMLLGAVLGLAGMNVSAQSLSVADYSFEEAVVPFQPPYVTNTVPGWTTGAYAEDVGVFFNFPGQPSTIGNADGFQVAYIASYGAFMSQQLTEVIQPGKQYAMSAGIAVSLQYPPMATDKLTLSLFYLDDAAVKHVLAATDVLHNAAAGLSPTELKYFAAQTPVIAAGDPAVGRRIGLEISTSGQFGYFDVDNVRASVVPEPAVLSMLSLAAVALGRRVRRALR